MGETKKYVQVVTYTIYDSLGDLIQSPSLLIIKIKLRALTTKLNVAKKENLPAFIL